MKKYFGDSIFSQAQFLKYLLILTLYPCHLYAKQTSNEIDSNQLPSIQFSTSVHDPIAIHLNVKASKLDEVLLEIKQKTGTLLHYSTLPEEPITKICNEPDIKHVLQCLLGNQFSLVYLQPQSDLGKVNQTKAEEIWILGPNAEHKHKIDTVNTPDSSRLNIDQKDSSSMLNPKRILGYISQLSKGNLNALQRKQTLSELAALGKTDAPEIDNEIARILEAALNDESAEIRAQAVFGLTQQDSPNIAEVLLEAIHDQNPDVRLMAVDSAKMSDPQSQAILHEALSDSEENIRAAAMSKLGMNN